MQLERKFLLLTSWTNQNCDPSLLKLKFKAVVHVWLLVRGAYPLTSLASVGTTRNHNECHRRLRTPYDTAFLEGCDYCMCQYPPLMTFFKCFFKCFFYLFIYFCFCFVLFVRFRRASEKKQQPAGTSSVHDTTTSTTKVQPGAASGTDYHATGESQVRGQGENVG